MPHRIEKLRSTVNELESELASIETVDTATRAVLEEAIQELQQALGDSPETLEHHTVAERLREAAADFESSHPTLFGLISRTVDALGQMGI